MRRSLGEVLEDRSNALTPIRLLLACLVLGAHAASISGLAEHPLLGGVGLGTWAVMAFFAISGYLVTQSRDRLRLGRFLMNRAARILPGFWVANVLTALVAAPIAAVVVGSEVDWSSALLYPLRNALLVMNQWTIDGTLTSAPYTDVWNGSLWTLAQEGGWYLVVGAGFLLGVVRRNLPASAFLLVVGMTGLNSQGVPWSILGAFFASGMLLYGLRSRVPVSRWLIAVAAVLCIVAGALHQVVLLAPMPLAYLVLAGSALRLPGRAMSTDLSYGVYIYAFPVTQLLTALQLQRWGLPMFTLMSAVLTTLAAAASWRLVEAPALRVPPFVASRRRPAPESRAAPASVAA